MALALKAPSFVIYPHQSIAEAATDRLGEVQAKLAPLKNEEAAIKQLLRDSGLDVIEGDHYRATVSVGQPGTKVNWEALARAYVGAPILDRVIAEFTTATEPAAARISVKAKRGV